MIFPLENAGRIGERISDRLAQIISELRALGVNVTLTAHIDAARALMVIDAGEPELLRACLAATLVKERAHLAALHGLLDLFLATAEWTQTPALELLAALDEAAFARALADALYRSDTLMLRHIAREAVNRHGGIVPGRPVGGSYYVNRTLRRLNLPAIETAMANRTAGATASESSTPLDRLIAEHRIAEGSRLVREAIDAEVRCRLVEDRGVEAVARARRKPLMEDVAFLTAAGDQLVAIGQVIPLVARRLARSLRSMRRRQGALDMQRTVRCTMASGGTLLEINWLCKRPRTPELIVIADVSDSVASFAYFTFALVHSLMHHFPRIHIYAFMDEIADVTSFVSQSRDIGAIAKAIASNAALTRIDGHSDYGHAFRAFAERWASRLTTRSIVLVLGDARNNYRAAETEALAAIARRAGALYWLNPESRANWATGDSDLARYAPICTAVEECCNLRQLRRFADRLA